MINCIICNKISFSFTEDDILSDGWAIAEHVIEEQETDHQKQLKEQCEDLLYFCEECKDEILKHQVPLDETDPKD